MVKHITLETIRELYVTTTPKSLGIADLGCSSGHNSLSIIREMVDTIEEASRKQVSRPVPEFRICLNDLPTNDFNAIFAALPEFYDQLRGGRNDAGPPTYIAGYPGSFYGRLFPSESLHFIYSCYSLHWLSKVTFFYRVYPSFQLKYYFSPYPEKIKGTVIFFKIFFGSHWVQP